MYENLSLLYNIIIIGVTGLKRHGKDTTGDYLVKNHGYVKLAFAELLKQACKIIFGLTDQQLYGSEEDKERMDEYWKHSPREILQQVGTELFRETLPKVLPNISNDIWIRCIDKQIRNLIAAGHTKIVITDMRFDNEIEYIKQIGGLTWKVIRPSLLQNSNDSDGNKTKLHSSETRILDLPCDKVFLNDSTLNDLFEKIEQNIPQYIPQYIPQ